MKVPLNLLRTAVTVRNVTATGTGVTLGTPTVVKCRWEYYTDRSGVPSDSVRCWMRPETVVSVGDQLSIDTSILTVDRVVKHLGPTGTLDVLEVTAS